MMESGEPKLSAEERNARDGNFLEEVVIDQCDQIAAKVRVGLGIYIILEMLTHFRACCFHGVLVFIIDNDFLAPYFPHSFE